MKTAVIIAIIAASALALPQGHPKGDNVDSRIIGGQEAVANSHPYIGYLDFFKYKDGTNWHCGGTLISPNYVLTSATCAFNSNLVEVILGVHDIYKAEPTQLIYQATEMLIHPDFDNNTYANDICLVKLPQTTVYSDAIQPAVLPTSADASYEGTKGLVSGWGITETGKLSEVLLDAEVEITSNSACQSITINDDQVCTAGQQGPCSQDFGGPLVASGTSNLIGIASHGDGNCQSGSPAAYTKVANYLSWIQENSDVKLV